MTGIDRIVSYFDISHDVARVFPAHAFDLILKGYVFVLPDGYDSEDDLNYWLDMCIQFNPEARSSKRKS